MLVNLIDDQLVLFTKLILCNTGSPKEVLQLMIDFKLQTGKTT